MTPIRKLDKTSNPKSFKGIFSLFSKKPLPTPAKIPTESSHHPVLAKISTNPRSWLPGTKPATHSEGSNYTFYETKREESSSEQEILCNELELCDIKRDPSESSVDISCIEDYFTYQTQNWLISSKNQYRATVSSISDTEETQSAFELK